MKIRKLSMFLMAVAFVFCVSGIKAFAAETGDAAGIADAANQSLEEEKPSEAVAEEALTPEAVTAEGTVGEITEKTEEGAAAVKEAVADDVIIKEDKEEKETVKEQKKAAYTEEELRLLASLIYCEANGQPYSGKLAVGIVVMNRKESAKFPNSIYGVIYDKRQFSPARNGSLSRTLSRYDAGNFNSQADKECIRAAKAALNGEKAVPYRDGTSMKGYYYFNSRVSGARLQIADHQFK